MGLCNMTKLHIEKFEIIFGLMCNQAAERHLLMRLTREFAQVLSRSNGNFPKDSRRYEYSGGCIRTLKVVLK